MKHTISKQGMTFQSFIIVFLMFLVMASACRHRGEVTGGNCNYKDFPGIITIKSIGPINSEGKNNSSVKTLIEYEFIADDKAAPSSVRRISEAAEVDTEEMREKDIKAGKLYRASASYQISGTCNPGPYLQTIDDWKQQ